MSSVSPSFKGHEVQMMLIGVVKVMQYLTNCWWSAGSIGVGQGLWSGEPLRYGFLGESIGTVNGFR